MKIECRPISTYPVPETRYRKKAPFHRVKVVTSPSGYNWRDRERVLLSDSLGLLEREVLKLGCTHLVIEADFKEGQIRQDGWPYAKARPLSPRVVVSLANSKHGPLRYPCDRFDRFEDNVRAVGLALEALRLVDRYGVTSRGEQYTGWKALPASTGPTMTVEAAAALVFQHTGPPGNAADVVSSADRAKERIRLALMMTHPDKGGQSEAFHHVQTARKVLSAHHGVSL